MRIMTRNVTRTLIRSDAVMALALVIPGDNFRRLDKFRPRNLLLLLLLLLLLCSAHAGNPAPTLAPTGTLRAVYIATNPVQAFVDPKTKEVRGPAAEIARELGKRAGVPVI